MPPSNRKRITEPLANALQINKSYKTTLVKETVKRKKSSERSTFGSNASTREGKLKKELRSLGSNADERQKSVGVQSQRLKIVKKTPESKTKGTVNANLRKLLKISERAEGYTRPKGRK